MTQTLRNATNRTAVPSRHLSDGGQSLDDARAYLDHLARGLAPGPDLVAGWGRFYSEHAPLISATIRAHRRVAVDADDAAQEVWLALLDRLGGHGHGVDRARFRGWLFVMARNRLSDLARQATRRRASRLTAPEAAALIGDGDDPAVLIDRDRDRELVHLALAELRPRITEANYRILQLRWVEGWTVAEVAAVLTLTQEQVRYRSHRLRKRLKDCLLRVAPGLAEEGSDEPAGGDVP